MTLLKLISMKLAICVRDKYLLADIIPILFDQFNQCVYIVHVCFGVHHENVIGILFFGEISVQNKCEIALVVCANGVVGCTYTAKFLAADSVYLSFTFTCLT